MQAFEDLMAGLRGGITPEEGMLLRRLAAECVGGCIVEVGSFRGKSAIALAWGIRDRPGGTPPPDIYCIEPHRPFTGFYGGHFGAEDRGAFYAAMVSTEAFREVALVNLSSEEVTPSWRRPVALLFIDGDHRYEGVRRDFECWDPHVPVGGKVAFDDSKDPKCGPIRVIEEILAEGRYLREQQVGKVTVLRKILPGTSTRRAAARRRLLVACERMVPTGGIFRFVRTGEVLQGWGHELAFLSMSGQVQHELQTSLPVLTMEQAAGQVWDAVMVPGAGFPGDIVGRFSELRAPQFGVRVQHVLNDQSRRAAFKAVNRALAPQVVVFNNLAWPAGTFTDFAGDRFHVLLGAVDTARFRPSAGRRRRTDGKWIVGGLVNKNPDALVAALPLLPGDVGVRLYGHDSLDVAGRHAAWIAAGRLQLAGPLDGTDLPAFYRNVDCVVSTELFAGWSNLGAEAVASGVPLVCTPHGTQAFAEDMATGLVVPEPEPRALAEAIARLKADDELCATLAEQGRARIESCSWHSYAQKLLDLCEPGPDRHYSYSPELGLHGKWPLAQRTQGLQPLMREVRDRSVIDFGAAEGLVGRELLLAGARELHGFELDASRVAQARRLCAAWPGASFRVADLSDWESFRAAHGDLLKASYDIVLYLGIHHHLPQQGRIAVLRQAARLAKSYFAVRMPEAVFRSDRVDEWLAQEGLARIGEDPGSLDGHLGPVQIYARKEARRE